jgi:hypothetical protein
MPVTGIKENSEPIQLTFRASVHLTQRMPVRAPEPAPSEAQPSTGKARRQQRDAVPYPLNYDRRVLDLCAVILSLFLGCQKLMTCAVVMSGTMIFRNVSLLSLYL